MFIITYILWFMVDKLKEVVNMLQEKNNYMIQNFMQQANFCFYMMMM